MSHQSMADSKRPDFDEILVGECCNQIFFLPAFICIHLYSFVVHSLGDVYRAIFLISLVNQLDQCRVEICSGSVVGLFFLNICSMKGRD